MKRSTIWFKYLFHGSSLPASHNLHEGDFIFAPAFGRNDILDTELGFIGKLFLESNSSDELTIQKLKSLKFDTGKTNHKIAGLCQMLSDHYNLPIVVQWEIALGFDHNWYEQNKSKVICIWPPHDTNYFSTYDIAIILKRLMQQRSWQKPILIAHDSHIVRAYLVLHKFGIESLIPFGLPSVFDEKSVQWFTRGKTRWILRETLVRVHHILKDHVDFKTFLSDINEWLNEPVIKIRKK